MTLFGTLAEFGRTVAVFLLYLGRRTASDNCPETASSLTFTSLLALVPLMAIGFATFSAFPVFTGMREDIQAFVFNNFVPHSGEVIQQYLETFTQNAGQLTIFGLVGLAVAAVMLLATIEGAFNRIWRVERQRPLLVRILAFWAILTVGPVLFGFSLSISSFLFAYAQASGVEEYAGSVIPLARLAPATLGFVGFTVLYTFIANRPVRWRHAAAGALTATILFELLKKGFGLYVSAFPTYQAIYGALSVLPILLLWIYLSWLVALLGAEVTAALPEWRGGATGPLAAPPPHRRLKAAVALLEKLQAGHDQGNPLKRRALSAVPDLAPFLAERVMADLVKQGYAAETDDERYVLARDLSNVPLYQLCADLDLLPTAADDTGADGLMRTVDGALKKDLDMPLEAALKSGSVHELVADEEGDRARLG